VRAGSLLHRHTIPLRAVYHVALRIQPGETLGLVGESGCGRSTLGRLLIRPLPPTAGNVIFDGADITRLRPAELREKRRANPTVRRFYDGPLNHLLLPFDVEAKKFAICPVIRGDSKSRLRCPSISRVPKDVNL
jgi:ABC-type oligopeptide transport system ATPase subunit